MKLSILICTLPKRLKEFISISGEVNYQIIVNDIKAEVLYDDSEFDSIGEKRNRLLGMANGEYVCFVDDDDDISNDYINLLMEGINKGVDCCSLKGVITTDGHNPEIFEHSIKYREWKTTNNEIKYERYPNHLNCIKSSIAKQLNFPEKNFGEDHDWSKQLYESGLLKTEHYIEQPIYFYKYISKK